MAEGKKQGIQMFLWDVTIPETEFSVKQLKDICKKHGKKWCFQREEGKETGYRHFQLRISLKEKKRLTAVKKIFGKKSHCSVSSSNSKGTFSYVMKTDTRIDDDYYSNENQEIEKPWQLRKNVQEYPWQLEVRESCGVLDDRVINWLWCPKGNIGKTFLCMSLHCERVAEYVPACNDFKDLMQMLYGKRTAKAYMVDLPRALDKGKMSQMIAGLEQLKNGYIFDSRYQWKEKIIGSPVIWVFSNTIPYLDTLSSDRWRCWEVVDMKLKNVPDNWASVWKAKWEKRKKARTGPLPGAIPVIPTTEILDEDLHYVPAMDEEDEPEEGWEEVAEASGYNKL